MNGYNMKTIEERAWEKYPKVIKHHNLAQIDINEEKLRLQNHLDYFLATLENGHGQGKKLGFISQEMGREINTLGSKANQADLQKLVVMMKDHLEQIKEQVLNVM